MPDENDALPSDAEKGALKPITKEDNEPEKVATHDEMVEKEPSKQPS